MADGTQHSFNFRAPLASALRPGEIMVDLFAGGGGASEALKQALGRDPDLAYNHDELAVGLHAANHPFTAHKREDIWVADPRREVGGRAVGWFHASPDCTHFSQAKGGQPRSRATRSLSWVVLKWAGALARVGNAPRIISLENVEQILTWGPLVAKRCKATGRVIKLDGTVAAKGESVSVWNQALVPDKRHAGRTWSQFVGALRAIGYVVDWKKLVASDYGAGTSRKRLFLIARRDGQPIAWPAPTHGKAAGLLPLVTAADCIDFSVPCPSIFTRKKPLADATMRRIAKGLKRYVIDAAEPFIVSTGVHHERSDSLSQAHHRQSSRQVEDRNLPHCGNGAGSFRSAGARRSPRTSEPQGGSGAGVASPFVTEHANASTQRTMPANEPLRTICAQVKGGHFAVVAPTLVGVGGRAGQTEPRPGDEPLITITSKADCAMVAAHLVKFRGDSKGAAADEPMPTITSGAGAKRPAGAAHAMGVITAFLEQANGGYYDGDGHDLRKPAPTICGTGSQQRLVTADLAALSPEHEAGALQVAAFLIKYYGTAHGVDIAEPLDTITTRDRLALVTVTIKGTPYVIVDIGLRMLRREELFRAQGFPADYIIDRTADGTPLSISASVRMVGNSVSPPPLTAIARANLDRITEREAIAA